MMFVTHLKSPKARKLQRLKRCAQFALLAVAFLMCANAKAQNAPPPPITFVNGVATATPNSAPPSGSPPASAPTMPVAAQNTVAAPLPSAPQQPTGIQPIPATQMTSSPATSSDAAGNMSIGQKIDLITLKDLENKLQATPDPIFMRSSRTYQLTLMSSLNKEIDTSGAIAPNGAEKTPE